MTRKTHSIGTFIENTSTGNLRGVTVVGTNAVYYSVEQKIDDQWLTTWDARVDFGRDASHRPGGYAFKKAAQDQEFRLFQARVNM
jgi:hypothetical protein